MRAAAMLIVYCVFLIPAVVMGAIAWHEEHEAAGRRNRRFNERGKAPSRSAIPEPSRN